MSRSRHPGVLRRCPSPQRVTVPHDQAALLALKPGTVGEGFKGASYKELVLRSSTQILGASLNQGAPL